MDELVRAVVLGIVQGLTEFLPISSSGHLILIPALFGWQDQGLAFDVGLHLGTMVALLAYFWRDWATMFAGGLLGLAKHRLRVDRYPEEGKLLALIAVGSIPAGVVGLLFNEWIEENVRKPWLVAITLAVVGTVMLVADRTTRQERGIRDVGLREAVLIGIAQATALIPGVSRSGATITTALFLHFTRNDAARFAFLLGTPAFVGAALIESSDLWSEADGGQLDELLVGFATSTLVGFAVIHYLLRYLRTRTLLPFVIYRYGVAALTLIIAAIRVA